MGSIRNGVCVWKGLGAGKGESLNITADMKFQWETYVATNWGDKLEIWKAVDRDTQSNLQLEPYVTGQTLKL